MMKWAGSGFVGGVISIYEDCSFLERGYGKVNEENSKLPSRTESRIQKSLSWSSSQN